VHHTGRGLPWFAKALLHTAALAVTRSFDKAGTAAADLGFTIGG